MQLRARLKHFLFEGDVLRLMGLTLLVKPVGLFTQVLLARYFGAGSEYDAYAFAVFLVSFFDSSVGQVFNALVVPQIIRLRRELPFRDLMRYQNAMILLFLAPVVVYMTILALKSHWIIGLIGPNLPAATRVYVDRMVTIMALPGVAMLGVTMGKSVLNLNRRYNAAGAMPLVNAFVILAALVCLHDKLGIWCLVAGFFAANVLQMTIIHVFALGTRSIAMVGPQVSSNALRVLWAMGWMQIVAQVLLALNLSIDKIFATGLEVGSISAIAYSMTIMNMGMQLFGFSLVVVMFTRMSEFFAAGALDKCNAYIQDNISRMTRIVVPASLALSVASGEVIRVLFQRGAFDAADAARTAGALSIYLLGLPAWIVNMLVARIYHSMQRLRDRMWLAAQFLATNACGNALLVGLLQVRGLALSTTLAINLHLALSLWVLDRYRTGLLVWGYAATVARSYSFAVIAYAIYRFSGIAAVLDAHAAGSTVPGAVVVAGARTLFILAVYYAAHLVWRRFAQGRRR